MSIFYTKKLDYSEEVLSTASITDFYKDVLSKKGWRAIRTYHSNRLYADSTYFDVSVHVKCSDFLMNEFPCESDSLKARLAEEKRLDIKLKPVQRITISITLKPLLFR